MSILRRAARTFKLGKERYFVGTDLEGNAFYERPSLEDPTDWRHAKRSIEYVVARPLSDYQFQSMPVQWNAWMRRTRKDPPSLEELQIDVVRQQRLKENVDRLAIEYKEEKLRLRETAQSVLEEGRSPLEAEVEQIEAVAAEPVAEPVVASVASEESLEEAGKRAFETERQEAKERREDFARQQAAVSKGNPSDTYQPESWSPGAAPRRR